MTDFGALFTRMTEPYSSPYSSPDWAAGGPTFKPLREKEREATVKFIRSWADSAKEQIVSAIRYDLDEDLLALAHEAYTAESLADSIEAGEHLHE